MRRQFQIDFVGRWKVWALLTATVVTLSALALVLQGLRLSLDFVGGSSFTVSGIGADVTAPALAGAAGDAGARDVSAQLVREGDRVSGAIVETEAIDPGSDTENAVTAALGDVAAADEVEVSFVGPTWGERISRKMLQALFVFMAVVILYLSVRLEFKMAVVAIGALLHDLVFTAGVYALFQFRVSPATVIALLTILGYSLYDTAIVFDRIQESTAQIGGPGRRTYSESVNTAMNDVLWRSLNTSVTSLLPVAALTLVGAQALGATTLQDLSIALFVGMASGIHSSLFIAGPAIALWKEREPRMVELARRAELRGTRRPDADERDDEEAAPARTRLEPRGYVRGPGRRPRSRR